jgi:hypothetical protein
LDPHLPVAGGTHSARQEAAYNRQRAKSPSGAELENELVKQLIDGASHPDFPHIIALEWYYDNQNQHLGKGDVVYSNFPFLFDLPILFLALREVPAKVLIIECKGITGDRTKKRRKVKEQLESSMAAWRKQRPLDEIWGCIYTNENPDWWNDMKKFDDITIQPLSIELLPVTAWAKIYKPQMPPALWEILLDDQIRKNRQRCSICHCHSKHPLVLHQRWFTRPPKLLFIGFEALCRNCHDVKHAGRSRACGIDILPHLQRVNNCPEINARACVAAAGEKWSYESTEFPSWEIDSTAFDQLPLVIQWKSENPRSTIKFGSLCCIFDSVQKR